MTDKQKKEILNSLKNNGPSPRDVYVNGEIGGIRIGDFDGDYSSANITVGDFDGDRNTPPVYIGRYPASNRNTAAILKGSRLEALKLQIWIDSKKTRK